MVRMQRGWLPLLVVACTALIVSASAPATAVSGDPPSLTIDPTNGLAGTTIHVSGTGCPDASWDTTLTWQVRVQTQQPGSTPSAGAVTPPSGTPTTPIAFPALGYSGLAVATVTPAGDGTWSADIALAASGSFAAPPGSYAVGAFCYAAEGAEAGTIEYPAQVFAIPVIDPPPPPPPPLHTEPNFTG